MKFTNSKTSEIFLNNQRYFVKRDDLLHSDFSGNKARKFYYFLKNNLQGIEKIISHGSNQSNAMYSLSVLCKLKNLNFDYYVSHLPDILSKNPNGNYKESIKNGMNLIIGEVPQNFKENELFISEGGAVKEASFGKKESSRHFKKREKIPFWETLY